MQISPDSACSQSGSTKQKNDASKMAALLEESLPTLTAEDFLRWWTPDVAVDPFLSISARNCCYTSGATALKSLFYLSCIVKAACCISDPKPPAPRHF